MQRFHIYSCIHTCVFCFINISHQKGTFAALVNLAMTAFFLDAHSLCWGMRIQLWYFIAYEFWNMYGDTRLLLDYHTE